MTRRLITLALPFLLLACAHTGGGDSTPQPDPVPPPVPQEPTPEERAIEIAQAVEQEAGLEALQNTRGVRFLFAGFRLHHWDRFTGDHRVDARSQDGTIFVIIHNVNNPGEGVAFRNGEPTSGEELATLLQTAYGAWINDTYWLLFPFKLRDPGVNLTYDGEETLKDQVYDKLHLTFESVGLTPGDAYWAYVNQRTHRVDRWAYHLESFEEDQPPTAWDWSGYERHNGVLLSSNRTLVGSDRQLNLTDIELMAAMPEGIFTSTEALELP